MADTKRITKDSVEGVAEKLAKFAQGLPDQERDVLGWILTRAQSVPATDPGEVEPRPLAGFRTSMASELARSAGFGPNAGTTEVTWGYKFKTILGPERLR